MFGSTVTLIALIVLAMLSAGALAYAAMYARIESDNKSDRRLNQIQNKKAATATDGVRGRSVVDAARRRKSVQETLKEIEEKQRAKAKRSNSPPLSLRMEQAGLNWSRRTFYLFSLGLGVGMFLLSWLISGSLLVALAFLVVGLVGMPRWVVNFIRKRRLRRFLDEFANAVDVIVRGVKAGLPINDCIKIIGHEAAEPVKSEFRHISDTQALGISLPEAVQRLPERVPVAEANFFAIVITIQQKAGGNLSEALANLSRVLRERRKMKGKIAAMSMEAKASAVIIGALPIVVMGLVYLTSPKYISLLFTDPVGNIILAGAACWMTMGIVVMRRMINFDF
jgi:tight adherence protein B